MKHSLLKLKINLKLSRKLKKLTEKTRVGVLLLTSVCALQRVLLCGLWAGLPCSSHVTLIFCKKATMKGCGCGAWSRGSCPSYRQYWKILHTKHDMLDNYRSRFIKRTVPPQTITGNHSINLYNSSLWLLLGIQTYPWIISTSHYHVCDCLGLFNFGVFILTHNSSYFSTFHV